MSAQLEQAERLHLKHLMHHHPGTLTLGTLQLACAVLPRRGSRFEMDTGQRQERRLACAVPAASLGETELIDATGATRTRTVSHLGLSYQIEADGVEISPHRTYYTIKAAQAVKG